MLTTETSTERRTLRAVRVIFRCRACKTTTQRQVLRSTRSQLPRTVGGVYYPGRSSEPTYHGGDGRQISLLVVCACGRQVWGRPVEGRYSAAHKCGARCLSATGTSCECQCGGQNHGAGHSEA